MPKNNIECEIRSFVTEDEYERLVEELKKKAEFLGEDNQVTYYFDSDQDLRIQKNDNFSKVWLKKGSLHDEHREEVEIKCAKDDFDRLNDLFTSLGYGIDIKWLRRRLSFKWDSIDVALDYTKGYGYIIELEKLVGEGSEEETLEHLKKRMNELGISLTPKEEFDAKYKHYKENWESLV
ncbi:MAG: CYTH domain-containing protein [Patescibacteria group bacterium]|nr:CYTH domain-containing protein [Patescibacteria group bacterium]